MHCVPFLARVLSAELNALRHYLDTTCSPARSFCSECLDGSLWHFPSTSLCFVPADSPSSGRRAALPHKETGGCLGKRGQVRGGGTAWDAFDGDGCSLVSHLFAPLHCSVSQTYCCCPSYRLHCATHLSQSTLRTTPYSHSNGNSNSSSTTSSSGNSSASSHSSSSTALVLKLASALAWPCISAAAVSGAIRSAATASPAFSLAVGRVAVSTIAVVVVLTVGIAAARFSRDVAMGHVDDAAAVAFGMHVGLLCGAQAVVNLLTLALGLLSGGVGVRDVLMAVVSTAVLARVSTSIWMLQGETRPSSWLQAFDSFMARPAVKS